MAEENDDTEKQHEPTQKKLDDARRKGEVPKSVDITTAAGYAGLVIAMLSVGTSSLEQAGTVMASLIERADQYAEVWFGGGGLAMGGDLIRETSMPMAAWFAIPAAAALLAVIAQRAFVVAPSKLQPKLNRISPLSNLKNKFGRSGLFEFFKSFVKLLIYSFILFLFLYWNLDEILALVKFGPLSVLYSLAWLSVEFLAIVVVIAGKLGAIDFLFQYTEHMRKHRMSRKELTDETKQSEGDPHLKQERRQRAYDIATNRMLEDVPKADVVVVNPTHYAVALRWSRAPGTAPECVAKGVDEVAARIREVAQKHGVPIHSDPATARAIFATVEIGQEVRPDQYQAVAAAIRFAETMREKARVWG
jgi:flagellar biosynthetic protein FlhB